MRGVSMNETCVGRGRGARGNACGVRGRARGGWEARVQECGARRLGAVVVVEALRLGHVGERRHVDGHAQRARELRLACGLVPARKAAPRIDRLELRRGHQLVLALDVLVSGAVEATHLVVEHARVHDVQLRGAPGQRVGEAEGHRRLLGVHLDVRRQLGTEGGRGERELLGMQRQLAQAALAHFHVDGNVAVKGMVLEAERDR